MKNKLIIWMFVLLLLSSFVSATSYFYDLKTESDLAAWTCVNNTDTTFQIQNGALFVHYDRNEPGYCYVDLTSEITNETDVQIETTLAFVTQQDSGFAQFGCSDSGEAVSDVYTGNGTYLYMQAASPLFRRVSENTISASGDLGDIGNQTITINHYINGTSTISASEYINDNEQTQALSNPNMNYCGVLAMDAGSDGQFVEFYIYNMTITTSGSEDVTITPVYPTEGQIINDYEWINFTTNYEATPTINNTGWYRNTTLSNATEHYFSANGTTPNGNISINIDGTNTSLNLSFIIDTITPTITANFTNGTFAKQGNTFTYSFNISDVAPGLLWGWNITINGDIINYTENIQNSTASITLSNSSWLIGRNNISVWAADAHTDNKIKDYSIFKNDYAVTFDGVGITSSKRVQEIRTTKLDDRYSMCFEYNKDYAEVTYTVPDTCEYQYMSNYRGHFVCKSNDGLKWLDFEGDHKVIVVGNSVLIIPAKEQDNYCFNSIGSLNENTAEYYIYVWNATSSGDSNTGEGTSQTFTLNIEAGTTSFNSEANLIYNNTVYSTSKIIGSDHINHTATITTPSVDLNTNISWYFNYSFDGTQYNTTLKNQTVTNIELDNCGSFSDVLINFTLKDENTKAVIPNSSNTTIEVDITLTNGIITEQYSTSINNNNLSICLSNASLPGFTIDITATYVDVNYAQEFFFLDNGSLTYNTTHFNNHTPKNIDFYDLLLADSTTFLFTFLDGDGLSVDNAIIHTYRKYIGDGVFREVERSKQDNNGETHVHLVEEDVIYQFMVTQYGNVIFTSDTYNAKCLSTPCQIQLEADDDITKFPTDWSTFNGVSFNPVLNKTDRSVTLNFISDNNILINMSIYQYNNNEPTLIVSNSTTAAEGSVSATIPNGYGNTTFFMTIAIDGTFVNSRWIDFRPTANDYFGATGLIMGALLILAIALMTLSEGVILIVGVILALFIIGALLIIDLTWLAFISIASAGGIIIWKIIKRRRQ